jgi:hypothetical protein
MAMEVRQLVDGGQTAWRRRVNILGVEGKRRAKGGQKEGNMEVVENSLSSLLVKLCWQPGTKDIHLKIAPAARRRDFEEKRARALPSSQDRIFGDVPGTSWVVRDSE